MTRHPYFLYSIIVAGTVIGLAGTDLVLPAIPGLPASLSGSLASAQLVLAGFTAGTALGLLVFGELGARYDQRQLLTLSLMGYGLFSLVSTYSDTMNQLVGARVFQGFFAAAPAVFAPGMIRHLFSERHALRALGLMGSIESVVPALAPVLGALLLSYFDWRFSFYMTSGLAVLLAVTWRLTPGIDHQVLSSRSGSNYLSLLGSRIFLRYALSHALSLGALLIFVFGAPTVLTVVMGGDLSDFVIMQVIGISLFIFITNTVHHVVDRIGSESTILAGSLLCTGGCISLLIYGSLFEPSPPVIWFLFAFVNVGIGLRGPPGFFQAILASGENDARGAAMVMLMVFAVVAGGTAITAPFISGGLVPLAAAASLSSALSIAALLSLPKLEANT